MAKKAFNQLTILARCVLCASVALILLAACNPLSGWQREHELRLCEQAQISGSHALISGDLEEASLCFSQALAHAQTLATDDLRTGQLRSKLAEVLEKQGQFEQDLPQYSQSLAIYDHVGNANRDANYSQDKAECLAGLANCYFHLGDCKKAQPCALEALNLYKRIAGLEKSPHQKFSSVDGKLISTMRLLASINEKLGNAALADQLHTEATEVESARQIRAAAGSACARNQSVWMKKLDGASTLFQDENYAQAEIRLREIVQGLETRSQDSPILANALELLARCYLKEKKYVAEQEVLQQRLKLLTGVPQRDEIARARTLYVLTDSLQHSARYDKAIEVGLQALAGIESTSLRHNILHGLALHTLAECYDESGDLKTADQYYTKADTEFRKRGSDARVLIFTNSLQQGHCLRRIPDDARAEQTFLYSLKLADACGSHQFDASIIELLAILYEKQQRYSAADELYRGTMIKRFNALKKNNNGRSALHEVAKMYLVTHKYKEAQDILEKLIQNRRVTKTSEAEALGRDYCLLGWAFQGQSSNVQALQAYRTALRMLPVNSPVYKNWQLTYHKLSDECKAATVAKSPAAHPPASSTSSAAHPGN